jgi:hypothetical protein
MRRSTKLVAALAVAGVVAAGGSAFTASNTMSQTSNFAGYGQATATGATITNITYTPLSTDASKLSTVVFASSTDVTGKVAKLTLKSGVNVVGTPYSCTLGAYTTTMDITCSTASDTPAFTAFDETGITITD